MSHQVDITTQFTDFSLLVKALNKLGWTVIENAKANTYPSDPKRETVHPFVAKNPNPGYDVGINFNQDGIVFSYDPYGGSIFRGLGKNFSELKKQYTLEIALEDYGNYEIVEQFEDNSMIIEIDDGN